MSFQFDPSFVNAHGSGKFKFYFSQDLRQFFPETDGQGKYGNNTIGDILKHRRVIPTGADLDTEYSCTYVYFKTKRDGLLFLKRLNAVREVKNWEPPKPTHVVLEAKEWDRMSKFLRKTLTTTQFEALINLQIMYREVVEPGGYN